MYTESRIQTLREVISRTNELEEKYANDNTPPSSDGGEEIKHPMIDAFYRLDGDETLLEMLNMNYDEYVKFYYMCSNKIEEYTRATRGR